MTWLDCWAHARRYFFEAQGDNRRIAQAALRLIGRMYRRERERDEQKLPPEQRGIERAKPEGLARTLGSLKRLAVWARQRVRPKSPLGKACDYLLRQWAPLSAHLEHCQSRLDNNLVEITKPGGNLARAKDPASGNIVMCPRLKVPTIGQCVGEQNCGRLVACRKHIQKKARASFRKLGP